MRQAAVLRRFGGANAAPAWISAPAQHGQRRSRPCPLSYRSGYGCLYEERHGRHTYDVFAWPMPQRGSQVPSDAAELRLRRALPALDSDPRDPPSPTPRPGHTGSSRTVPVPQRSRYPSRCGGSRGITRQPAQRPRSPASHRPPRVPARPPSRWLACDARPGGWPLGDSTEASRCFRECDLHISLGRGAFDATLPALLTTPPQPPSKNR